MASAIESPDRIPAACAPKLFAIVAGVTGSLHFDALVR
jgi:hypothetical protein